MSGEQITIRHFYNKLVYNTRGFVLYWEKESKEKREHNFWPDKMSFEEWHEQFLAHLEMEAKIDKSKKL